MQRGYVRGSVVAGALALAAIALGVLLWWQRQARVEVPAPAAAPAASAIVAIVPPASAPAVLHPIGPAASAGAVPGAIPADAATALSDLFGRKAVLALFQAEDFPRRFAATVDNLGRPTASARLWPMNPAPGRFEVRAGDGGAETLSADNGLRYSSYVVLLETVDLRQAASTYAALYPKIQQAYEELGYPGRYFNDRLVEVIDLLLATPDVATPPKVHLPPINGPVQPVRPWVLYEFEDPALQQLTSGQKLLLRLGPVNERRVKARLAEFRRLVATPPAAPPR